MATIKEISEKANVSTATVSKVLNGKGNVSQATRQMILDIARELHYRPNLNARCLKSGQSNTLGIITAGTYTFGVGDREIVTLITGEVEVKRPVDTDWVKFAAPQEFEIQANCEYDIRTYGVAEYLCDYYKD